LKQAKEEKAAEAKKERQNNEAFKSKQNGNSETISALQSYEYDLPNASSTSLDSFGDQGSCSVVRVYQRIKIERDDVNYSQNENDFTFGNNNNNNNNSNNNNRDGNNNNNNFDNDNQNESESSKLDVWALIEYEITLGEEVANANNSGNPSFVTPTVRFVRWRRFHSESAFSDHIRRDSGEPINVPNYSLSPKQSNTIEEEARQAVTHVTEEFRRFRVRAEVARKQADATVRALQSNNVQNAQKHIEGQDLASELAQARTDHRQLTALKAEMAEQEAHWKSAYDVLLAENNQLKSSGSEALLAAQWRQRYEACLNEKEKLDNALELEKEKSGNNLLLRKKEDSGKYEAKYKDLKESFRLYRKKAKEIFEAQHKGEATVSLGFV
jgi:hypothetical protein